jgi:Pentapeptide repeats (8 copies)
MLRSLTRRVIALLRRHVLQISKAFVLVAVFAILGAFYGFLAGVLGLSLLVFILWKVPRWQAFDVLDLEDRLTVENAARQTLAQIIGGMAILTGLYFTVATLRTAQEWQITDRFTKAITQLGEQGPEKLVVRLGGIYALERIARDSEKDHWPIMEVLTAYVRETAPRLPNRPKDTPPSTGDQSPREEPPTTPDQRRLRPTTDIQAILTVLGRRTHTYAKGEQESLDLADTDLRGANLVGAQLQGVNFVNAQLQGANFVNAQLQGARLLEAQLQGANLMGAQLQGAVLLGAQLQEARLLGAQLQEANLQGANLMDAQLLVANLVGAQLQAANLTGAQLQGANLTGAQLTVEQLSIVRTLYQAHLDPPLLEQIQQRYPQLLERL